MWLAPQKIKDNSLVSSNKAYVFYLPLSSPISLYLLISKLHHNYLHPLDASRARNVARHSKYFNKNN